MTNITVTELTPKDAAHHALDSKGHLTGLDGFHIYGVAYDLIEMADAKMYERKYGGPFALEREADTLYNCAIRLLRTL